MIIGVLFGYFLDNNKRLHFNEKFYNIVSVGHSDSNFRNENIR